MTIIKRSLFSTLAVVLLGGSLSACTAAVSVPSSLPKQVESSATAIRAIVQTESDTPSVDTNFTVTINSIVPYQREPQPGVDLDDPIYSDHLYTIDYTVTFIGTIPLSNSYVPRLSIKPPSFGEKLYVTQDEYLITKGDTFEFSIFVDEDLANADHDYFLVGLDTATRDLRLLKTVTLGPDDLT